MGGPNGSLPVSITKRVVSGLTVPEGPVGPVGPVGPEGPNGSGKHMQHPLLLYFPLCSRWWHLLHFVIWTIQKLCQHITNTDVWAVTFPKIKRSQLGSFFIEDYIELESLTRKRYGRCDRCYRPTSDSSHPDLYPWVSCPWKRRKLGKIG